MQLCHKLLFKQTSHRIPSIQFLGPRSQLSHETPYMLHAPDLVIGQPVISQHHHHITPQTQQPQNMPKPISRGPPTNSKFVSAPTLADWQIDAINQGGIIDTAYLKVKPILLKK